MRQLILLLISISLGAAETHETTVVSIPACVYQYKNQLEEYCKECHNEDIMNLLAALQDETTTLDLLHRGVHAATEIIPDCYELQQLNAQLTEVYRKKCCCWPTTVSTLTVTGVLTAGSIKTNSITFNIGPKILAGSGAPTISAPKGSLYLRTDGSTTNNRAYINTDGSTTWTSITTAA